MQEKNAALFNIILPKPGSFELTVYNLKGRMLWHYRHDGKNRYSFRAMAFCTKRTDARCRTLRDSAYITGRIHFPHYAALFSIVLPERNIMAVQRKLIMFACAAALVSSIYAGAAPQTLTICKGTTPTLDGTISSGEWADAVHIAGISGWHDECAAPNTISDLSLACYCKHDDTCVFFAFEVTDNIVYGIDTPRWVGAGMDSSTVHSLTSIGLPWYGDGIELMIDAANSSANAGPAGDGSSWKMVCSSHKSRLAPGRK